MKRSKMILSAVIVFAAVSGALAFKTRQNPNLKFCNENNKCVTAPYSDFPQGALEPTPPTLYKIGTNDDCDVPNAGCLQIDPTVTPVYHNS